MALLAEARGPYQGLLQVVEFNRRRYAGALVVIVVCAVVIALAPEHGLLFWLALVLAATTAWWSVASVVASHHVYDRSSLWRWTWLDGWLERRPRRWLHVHAGFDESTPSLQRLFPTDDAVVLDVFDERAMSEPSIAIARQARSASTVASFRHLSLPANDRDAVFLILSAHELRSAEDRAALFAELARVLEPGGCVVLVEHLRDVRNLLVYGPGALHFLPRRAWMRAACDCGLELRDEKRINAFVSAFVFVKPQLRG